MIKISFFIFLFLISLNSYASSCCGGGSSSSLIIVGDKKSELAIGLSRKSDFGQTDINANAHYNNKSNRDYSYNLNTQFAYQISDYSQIATKFSLIYKDLKKSKFKKQNFGFGDFEFQYSYEFLPEFGHSLIKPRGFIYTKIIIPSSKNMFNSNQTLKEDVRGFGYYGMTLGHFYTKKLNSLNLKFAMEWTHYFGVSHNQMKQKGFEKITMPLGLSYDLSKLPTTIGLTQTFNYQTIKKITGRIHSNSHQEQYWEMNFYANYSPNSLDMYTISYSDSSLIGKSINSPLYRSFGINYTRSWDL